MKAEDASMNCVLTVWKGAQGATMPVCASYDRVVLALEWYRRKDGECPFAQTEIQHGCGVAHLTTFLFWERLPKRISSGGIRNKASEYVCRRDICFSTIVIFVCKSEHFQQGTNVVDILREFFNANLF